MAIHMWAAKRSNVRAGPGTTYDKVDLLEAGTEVRVTGKTGSWFRLEPKPDQPARFVYAPLLTDTRPTARTVTYANGARYYGPARNGEPHGRGVFTWTGGERYEGDFVDGERHGRGIYTTPDKRAGIQRYDGEWHDGKMTGRGASIHANDTRYEGDFVDGQATGRGVWTWPNSNRYEGDFVDGQRTGRGVFTWANGSSYEGEFVNGQRTGRGTRTFADGDSYTQVWRDGKVRNVHRPESTCLDVERVNASMGFG